MVQLILKYPLVDLNAVKVVPLLPLIPAVVAVRVTNAQANGVMRAVMLVLIVLLCVCTSMWW